MAAQTAASPSFRTPVLYNDVLFGEWQLEKTVHFMERTHLPVSIIVTALYLAMVYYGPKYMAARKALGLRNVLGVWNICLSLYSGFSFFKLTPFTIQSYQKGGMIGSLCYNDDLYTNAVSGYWTWLFIMSKGPELMDTVFLILRKRPVIFLHWYHHSVTFLCGQVFFTELVPWARWGIIINLAVHTIMYFYYALRAFNIPTPAVSSKIITSIQISQFVSGFYFSGRVFYMWVTDELDDCQAKVHKMGLGLGLVFTYLYLFSDYFYRAYIKGDSPTRRKLEMEKTEEKQEAKKDM